MANNEIWRCCICGNYFKGWGNNPWPVSTKEDDQCCDDCNSTRVVPARIARMFGGANNESK